MGMKPRQRSQHRDPALPSLFAMLYQMLRRQAADLGYALALHGSLARDLDVVAIPWTEEAVAPGELVEALRSRVSAFLSSTEVNPTEKPHGRLTWALHLSGSGTYVDLSVTPRTEEP